MKLKHIIWLVALASLCGCNDDASKSKTDTDDCKVNGTCPSECDDPNGNCPTTPSCEETGTCPSDKCEDECTEDSFSCDGNTLSKCVIGDKGCTSWKTLKTCETGETCDDVQGQCKQTCGDGCISDEFSCDDADLRQCKADENGCTSWEVIETCGEEQICNAEQGQCVKECNTCTLDTKQCVDGGISTCIKDENDCAVWGISEPCGTDTKCDPETVTCVDGCIDECTTGETKCADGGMKTCGQYDSDSCTEWSAPEVCGTGMKCSDDEKSCVKACTDECTIGETKCDGDNVMTCEQKNDALCMTWSAAVACDMGQRCEGNKCAYTCGSDCKPFSIVLVPDTQYYTRKTGCTTMPEKESKNIEQMQKLAAKKDEWNIRYVIHLGDLTQKNIVKDHTNLSQWALASKAQKVLDDADIPNLPATGNHDYKETGLNSKNKCEDTYFGGHGNSHFKEYFNAERYSGKSWAPTIFKNSTESMYGTFNIGNIKFLVITLEFAARKETLCEADRIISAHPDHHVIIEMHNYLYTNNQLDTHNFYDVLYGAGGKQASKELTERHGNVFLVVAGHVSGSFYRETVQGTNGNIIREMLVDYQSESPKMCNDNGGDADINNGGNGWVRRIVIDPQKGTMKATTESMLGYTKLFCSSEITGSQNPGNDNYYPSDPTKTIEEKDNNNKVIGYTGHTPPMTGMDFGKTPTDNYKIGTYEFTTRQIGTGSRHQMNGAIAMNRTDKDDGIFVTVWEDDASDEDGNGNYDIRARISCTGGCNKSGFFYINDITKGNQIQPDVAMDANGNFVVVWADDNDGNGKYEIHMRGFKPDGSERFTLKNVNTISDGQQLYPKIAMADDGRFVVTWQDSSAGYDQVFMRGFKADGSEMFAQSVAAGGTSGTYRYPDIAMSSDGHFVIAWEDDNDGNGATQLKAQGFNADGSAQFNNFIVNTDSTRDQTHPAVAMNSKGDYAIAWLDERQTKGIFMTYVRGFKAGTSTQLIEEKAVSSAGNNTSHPDIVMDEVGNLGVTWESYKSKDSKYCPSTNTPNSTCNNIERINYNYAKALWGSISIVNNNPYNEHSTPAIAIDKKGRNVILWNDDSDGNSAYDIYMRGYNSL